MLLHTGVLEYDWNCELIEFCSITSSIGSCLGLFYSRVPTENVVRGMIFSQKRMLENHMTADRDRFFYCKPEVKGRETPPRRGGFAKGVPPKAENILGEFYRNEVITMRDRTSRRDGFAKVMARLVTVGNSP